MALGKIGQHPPLSLATIVSGQAVQASRRGGSEGSIGSQGVRRSMAIPWRDPKETGPGWPLGQRPGLLEPVAAGKGRKGLREPSGPRQPWQAAALGATSPGAGREVSACTFWVKVHLSICLDRMYFSLSCACAASEQQRGDGLQAELGTFLTEGAFFTMDFLLDSQHNGRLGKAAGALA
ncbi:hypothetical protein PAL_GLEAN10001164 [Pteropus alecto]|uniref:Uncharacterized protein n=1 Tax=Pteropus alecto TaxID=9402 RepID=L5KCP3_PTEAL|nr:hypothetical protein PAL_GLEAN10001164 [Pteropus alecto]